MYCGEASCLWSMPTASGAEILCASSNSAMACSIPWCALTASVRPNPSATIRPRSPLDIDKHRKSIAGLEFADWLGKAYGRRAETSSVLTAPFYASKTRESFEKAVVLDSVNLEARSDVFEYYLEAPRPLGGGMDKAEAIAARIGRLDAAEFACKLAALAEKRKQFDAAEQHLRRAVAMKPDQVGRMIDLGEFLARRGRYDECEDLLRAAGNRNLGSPSLMFAQASLEIRRGRNLAEAQRLLRSYLASPITPDEPPRLEALRLFKMVP